MPGTTELTVTRTERLSPGMLRVHFHSDDLSAFADSSDTDRYVKLALGPEAAPVLRTYTVLAPHVDEGTLAIDFVVHGDEGYAGPWATRAAPGDTLTVHGPGGGYQPDPSADWHLFAGDQSAIPAIRAALAALPPDARGEVLLEVPGGAEGDHRQWLHAPDQVYVTWVEVGGLAQAVRDLPWRDGRVHVFVHGEAEEVMRGVRPYLVQERGLSRADVSISGYWRRGRTEESFREWKQQLAAETSD